MNYFIKLIFNFVNLNLKFYQNYYLFQFLLTKLMRLYR